jgi:hypothetical protein
MSRESTHTRIDELLGLLSINNNRLSLHAEKLSQLDIDVLRKQCIELYEQINILAIEGRKSAKEKKPAPAPKEAEPIQPVVQKVEPVVETPEPIKEIKVKPAPKVAPKKAKAKVDDAEMKFLFQKFSSKPIESISKAISVVKKFEIQQSFFEGDSAAYKKFINALDNADSRDEAFNVYHETKKNYTWDNEDLRDEIKALMYRKFT